MKRSQRNAKNRRNMYSKNCPVKIGNEYKVKIADTTPNGVGIARIKGFIVLIDDTKLGDQIKVRITKTDSLSAEAKLLT